MDKPDPIFRLAFALQSSPGKYALVLGSGVSRAAGILTGWQITLDLIQRLAKMDGVDCREDPARWYRETYGGEPAYSSLLDLLAQTPAARHQLLRDYFETAKPSAAYEAIADLVQAGYIRVIVTTNFDRLPEAAFAAKGLKPVVLSTPDQFKRALPLVHQECCIAKIHGDCLDPHIRNTPAELAEYDPETNRFLDRVLSDFGLIVCGWSATYDIALRRQFEQSKPGMLGLFWINRSALTPEAEAIVVGRSGEVIQMDADTFFVQLRDTVVAVNESRRPHPDSVEALTALLKHYLSERRDVPLEELLTHEARDTNDRLRNYSGVLFDRCRRSSDGPGFPKDKAKVLDDYRDLTESLRKLLLHGCAFGRSEHDRIWANAIQRVAHEETRAESDVEFVLSTYPIVVLLYVAALSALSRNRYDLIATLLTEPKMHSAEGKRQSVVSALPWYDLEYRLMHERNRIPREDRLSRHLFDVLRPDLREWLLHDEDYAATFDRLEYLMMLTASDLASQAAKMFYFDGPRARSLENARRGGTATIARTIRDEIGAMGKTWPLLKAGLFGGSLERLHAAERGVFQIVHPA